MDVENTIRKVLEEGGMADQEVRDTLEGFQTISTNPRFNREWFTHWFHTFLDEPLPQELDKGEEVSEEYLLAVSVARAYSTMKIHYRFLEVSDECLENGEGRIPPNRLKEELLAESLLAVSEYNYRWLRIVGNEGGRERVLATIYLWEAIGRDVQRMLLARVRKGLPPNPYDALPIAYRQENGRPVRDKTRFALPDPQGSQGVKGVRATQRVHIEPREDNDHMWHFPGFKVRSSKLFPVLTGFRDLGKQYIELSEIQTVIQRMAQPPK